MTTLHQFLTISNAGQLFTESNYWQSEMAAAGLLYIDANAGAFRLLVPRSQRQLIADMRPGAKHVVLSLLAPERWPREGKPFYAVEWMVEDGSDAPWSCHLSAPQIGRLGIEADVGREFVATVWDWRNGRPHKCLERPAYFRIVPELPCLRAIERS